MTDTEPFQIPIDLGSLPKVFKKGIEIWYNFSFIPSSYIAASNFLSIYLAMIGLRAELRIAHDSISNIPNKVKYLNSIDGKDELFEQKKEFWIDLHSELKQSIQHHVEVLINLNILKNVTNLSFMLLYYMTMILIAAGVLIVIFNPVVDVFYVFAIDYTFRYVLECFVFCYTVSSLNATHFAIGEALVHQSWISKLRFSKQYGEQYRAVRAGILMELMESQRNLGINCGGMFELTLEKFTRIINTSYSLTMFLWTFRK
ncbi:hypothetical protein RP20_CCG018935 [Aedes albopictus]|nr:hypothetical protein RP20_CCG018935 [Aedes albopictus]